MNIKNNYVDVTKKWLKNATPNSHKIVVAKYYVDEFGLKYYVDGKYVKINYSQKEYNVAKFLKNTFGGKIYLLPEVNIPENVKTADYLWNDEKWDLKEILGNSCRNIDSKIKNSYGQSKNFIIDNSKNALSNNEVILQIRKLYNDSQRNWVDKIMLINNNEIIKIFKRRKKN